MGASSFAMNSVQELASKVDLETIPSRYIRSENEQDEVVVASLGNQVPVIDLSKLVGINDQDEMEKLHLACKDWGFFMVVNHGADEVIKKMTEDVTTFFKMSLDQREDYCETEGQEGYYTGAVLSEEQKVDWGDTLHIFMEPDIVENSLKWPNSPPTFRKTIKMYSSEMEKLKKILIGLMAKNLGIDEDKFINMFQNGIQIARINYYPPCPDPSKVLGITPHSDTTGLTILIQFNEVDGLQIRHNKKWVPIKMIPGAFLVNIGDIIEVFSNGIYKSIEHRVIVDKEKERISAATFHESHESVLIRPLQELITNGEILKYKSITYKELCDMQLSSKVDRKKFLDSLKLEMN